MEAKEKQTLILKDKQMTLTREILQHLESTRQSLNSQEDFLNPQENKRKLLRVFYIIKRY